MLIFLSVPIFFALQSQPVHCATHNSIWLDLWTQHLSSVGDSKKPRRYRTCRDSLPCGLNNQGLKSLEISGSGQFSEAQLQVLIQDLEHKGIRKEKIIIVDLREEPHGFVNALPFYWYVKEAHWLEGLRPDVILQIENEKLKDLKNKPIGTFYQILEKKKGCITNAKKQILSTQYSASECQLLAKYRVSYYRIPVTDHKKPDGTDVDQFLRLIQEKPEDTWFHFHCHAGRGRTSTFMILYDIMKNPALSLDEIIDRQVALGSLDLRIIKERKSKAGQERLDFIYKFYEYVHDADGYRHQTWTQWIKKNSLKKELMPPEPSG